MSNQKLLIKAVADEIVFLESGQAHANKIASLYRHNANKEIGTNPVLYGHILSVLPKQLHHKYSEAAFYTALTLYAFAGNQGNDSITVAISRIPHNENIVNRFRNAEMAKDINEIRNLLRSVVKIIKSQGESFNYALLAADLYNWQFSNVDQIRKWERNLIV